MTPFKTVINTVVCDEVTLLKARYGGPCGTQMDQVFPPLALLLTHLLQMRWQLREAEAWLARLISLWSLHCVQWVHTASQPLSILAYEGHQLPLPALFPSVVPDAPSPLGMREAKCPW